MISARTVSVRSRCWRTCGLSPAGIEGLEFRDPVAEAEAVAAQLKDGNDANGEADVYPRFGPTMEWDSAAGDAILRAAGGGIVTQSGEDLLYGKADQAYRNPHFIALGDLHLAEFFKLSPLS